MPGPGPPERGAFLHRPGSGQALEDSLITVELDRRDVRPVDRQEEAAALRALSEEAAKPDGDVLQRLAEQALRLCRARSAGVQLLDDEGGRQVLRWQAVAGEWPVRRGASIPLDACPSGIALAEDHAMLMSHPERYFPPAPEYERPIAELLLLPFRVADFPVGVAWVVAHDEHRNFDAEDCRVLTWLTGIAAVAHRLHRDRAEADERSLLEQQRREAHTRFLGEVQHDFDRLTSADEILQHVGRRVANYLSVSLTYVINVDAEDGAAEVHSIVSDTEVTRDRGIVRFSDYVTHDTTRASRTGQTVVVKDTRTDPRTRAGKYAAAADGGAYISVPFHHEGAWTSALIAFATTPRDWRDDEVELMRDLAHRIFPRLERARAEEALRKSEQRYRSLFNAIDEGFGIAEVLHNDEGEPVDLRFLAVNPAFEAQSGLSDATGRTLRELVPDIEDVWIETFGRIATCGRPERFIERSGPLQRWFSVYAFPTDGGKRSRVAILFSDISEQAASRKALEDSRKALQEADRYKDQFLAMLAHELRNPLAPLHSALQVLRQQDVTRENVDLVTAMMERQVDQLVRLVDDLLDVSRITRGKIQLRRKTIELQPVLLSAVETVRPICQTMDHHLEVDLPPESIYVDGDPVRLTQVFSNLLNNACKYMEPGGWARLAAEYSERGAGLDPEVVVTVEDHGIGIAREQLAEIFNLFSQVDTSLERGQTGLGIGLTLVKNLLELQGGQIEAFSEGLGRGSKFVVSLPSLRPAERARKPERRARARQPHRILVVDDNRDSADALALLLRHVGHETFAAYDGLEALRVAELERPDVVLLDLGMPKHDGYETCRRLRAEPWGRDMTIIAQTGWGQREDRSRTREAGFDGHLVKPINHVALEKLLAAAPGRHSNRS